MLYRAQAPGHLLLLCQVYWQGTKSKVEQPGFEPVSTWGCQCHREQSNLPSHNLASHIIFVYLFENHFKHSIQRGPGTAGSVFASHHFWCLARSSQTCKHFHIVFHKGEWIKERKMSGQKAQVQFNWKSSPTMFHMPCFHFHLDTCWSWAVWPMLFPTRSVSPGPGEKGLFTHSSVDGLTGFKHWCAVYGLSHGMP